MLYIKWYVLKDYQVHKSLLGTHILYIYICLSLLLIQIIIIRYYLNLSKLKYNILYYTIILE